MTPENLARIRAIYEAALAKDALERAAFLDQECQGDQAIRQEVDLLLAAQQRLPDWLREPLLAPAPILRDSAASLPRMEGRQLSGYKLVREIGHGGMGSVYLAERSDGAFRKQVAIKLVQPGVNSADILARFRQEREILASLDHPGIARLLDAATTEEGLPYFVMEFVDGRPIDRWCDDHKLNVTQRLQLFRKVCDAVQYAHQRLIVHRDLKPGNILVTVDGQVKLLDFGIAKLLRKEQKGEETTRTLMLMMTPEYASPEQVNGDNITTLTDVYSLGVVLYELLTGHRPHHLLKAAMREVVRVLSEEEPTRPSMVVATTQESLTPKAVSEVREGDSNRLRKRLEGDLDCIVLTALHREPARRYSSVEAFGEDLGRHLENRPVNAREDSFWYRANRFVRRHPSGVAAGILIALSAAMGVFTTLWELRMLIEVRGQTLSGPVILAPLLALFLYVDVAGFGVAVYVSRAPFLRAMGCLAGGAVFTIVWVIKLRVDYATGWWRSAFPETPEPLMLLSLPIALLVIMMGSGVLFLISWRVARRFGWAGQVAMLLGAPIYLATRDRVWWQHFMRMMVATPGVGPVLGDAAFFLVGLVLGYVAMRLIAGPARNDLLARGPQAASQI
jgi:serine/threonine protein kinase